MLRGVQKVADAVRVTLGPKGRNVVIEQSYGPPKITKDGVSVAKAIDLPNHFENLGAQLVRQAASKTADLAGDGTTTATILTHAIFSEGCKAVAAGMNPMDLRRGIQAAVEHVLTQLESFKRDIATKEEILQVATISANGEVAVGKLIADAMEKVGKDGVISVQDGKTLVDELEVVEGMKFDRGYVSPYFMNNTKNQKCEFDNPLILLVDSKVSSLHELLPLLEGVLKGGRALVIVAEDVDGEALGALLLNKLRSNVKVCAVKAPGYGENRNATLQDLAILTGGQLISADIGMKLEDVTPDMLGTCKKISISKDDTVVLGGAGSTADIQERCNMLQEQINRSTSDYDKEKLKERLAKLSGGVAVIKVGGASEVEVGEKKDRIDDALHATRAAVAEGIVSGGGTALLYATRNLLDVVPTQNQDQRVGVKIVCDALRVPCRSIADNAGHHGDVVVGKLLEKAEGAAVPTIGFNAATGEYVDMIQAGIIDPTKVVRTALVDAAGVASLMTTTECMIADAPKENELPPSKFNHGEGGMF